MVKLPALRIISDKLWAQVQKRRAATLEHFGAHRGADGRLNGTPEAGLIAAHLLNGFTVCGVCGGALTFMGKGKGRGAYRCQRRNSRGLHACRNAKGVPEAALAKAVMLALYKVIKDPKRLWRLYLDRAERWRQERALTVDVRANLETEEKRLEAAIERTRAAMRALGIGKVTVTPTPDGWRFEGDGSLAGMVHSGSVRAPQPPQRSDAPRRRPGAPCSRRGL